MTYPFYLFTLQWYKLGDTINNIIVLATHVYRENEGIICKIRLSAMKDDMYLDVSILPRNLDEIQRKWSKTALAICVSIFISLLVYMFMLLS